MVKTQLHLLLFVLFHAIVLAPSAVATFAVSLPMPPKPIRPNVLLENSSVLSKDQLFDLTILSISTIRLRDANAKVIVCSATAIFP